MGDIFDGWRRKIGVVTLVIACVFAGLSMNRMTNFGMSLPVGNAFYRMILTPEGISITQITLTRLPGETVLVVIPYSPIFVPLTALSAYLLLSKPGRPKPQPTHVS